MKTLSLAVGILGLGAVCATCTAWAADSATPRIAENWHPGHYDNGVLVTYDGAIYKAGAGASHRHPNPNLDEGWRKLYDCDEAAAHALQCDKPGGQVVSTDGTTKDNYRQVQDNMTSNIAPGNISDVAKFANPK